MESSMSFSKFCLFVTMTTSKKKFLYQYTDTQTCTHTHMHICTTLNNKFGLCPLSAHIEFNTPGHSCLGRLLPTYLPFILFCCFTQRSLSRDHVQKYQAKYIIKKEL